VIERPSPNCGPRRDGLTPVLIVLHYTAMQSAEAAARRLCDPEAEVSAHYMVGSDGAVWKLVDEDMRAWHAGAGSWQGLEDINSRSIGIELDNDGYSPFPEPLMAALEALLDDIMARRGIGPERIIAHSDLAPGRKIDPGARFDWRRLALGGRSIWPDPGSTGDFAKLVSAIGYPGDGDDTDVLNAFRLRFRPGADGPLSEQDRAIASGVAALDPSTATA
jgi:N-acetylmuramoyl-L-alanine amidase